ncbi:MAG: GIY-YIG nuclease family protein [Verrucomicrobia bacterium]|nr:MAG: GIY-YIG nuclease family protein [Verrucomicrobiota bacterium]
MFRVYILRSMVQPTQTYTGFTTDLVARLQKRNDSGSSHTAKYRPWQMIWSCAFADKGKTLAFETWLKSQFRQAARRRHASPDHVRVRSGAGAPRAPPGPVSTAELGRTHAA